MVGVHLRSPATLRTPAWNHIWPGHPTPEATRSALIPKWTLSREVRSPAGYLRIQSERAAMGRTGAAGSVSCWQDSCCSDGVGVAYVSRPIQAVSGLAPHPESRCSGKSAPFTFLFVKQCISMKQIGTWETMRLRMSRQLKLRDYPTERSFAGRPSGSGCRATSMNRAANSPSGGVCEKSRWRKIVTMAAAMMIAPSVIPRTRPAGRAISAALIISRA